MSHEKEVSAGSRLMKPSLGSVTTFQTGKSDSLKVLKKETHFPKLARELRDLGVAFLG